jgi:hypothetical protein
VTDGPWRDHMMPDGFYKAIDPGVRFAVRVLHAAGFETCQACQGGDGHAYHEPTVEMIASADDAQGFGAGAALQVYRLPVSKIGLTWNIRNGLPYEKLWSIVFSKTMEDRADDKPTFVHGHQARGS